MNDSMLSHEERAIAERLKNGATAATIAAHRDQDETAVEAAIDRIEEKTGRALATLDESPFLEPAIDDLDESTRTDLRERLEPLLAAD